MQNLAVGDEGLVGGGGTWTDRLTLDMTDMASSPLGTTLCQERTLQVPPNSSHAEVHTGWTTKLLRAQQTSLGLPLDLRYHDPKPFLINMAPPRMSKLLALIFNRH